MVDGAASIVQPLDHGEFHGVPRAELVQHAIAQIPPPLHRQLDAIELADGGLMVNLGMNFQRVLWRAVWRDPGFPAFSGSIPIRHGEIV